MNNAPTIVRLLNFPDTLRLARQGDRYVGGEKRSGAVILSERNEPIEVTFRVTAAGVEFATGATTVRRVEAFSEGEQRDIMVPWQLVVAADARIPNLILEIDVAYSGTTDVHTATAPLDLTYGVSRPKAAAVIGAVAAVATAAAMAGRRARNVVADDDGDTELSLFNIAPTSRTPAPASTTRHPKDAKVTVVDEEEGEVEVYNVGRSTRRASTRKASARKASPARKASSSRKASSARKSSTAKKASSAKKSSAKKTSVKKGSVKKAAPRKKTAARKAAPAKRAASRKKAAPAKRATPKKASAKKAGGTRRGSGASRSARRTGARGSSAARKASPRRTTRKSR